MNSTKVGLGAILLVTGTVLIFALAAGDTVVSNVTAAVATLGLAAGALLFGTGEGGRPV